MIDVKSLAKEIYERFGLEEHGQIIKWEYLGKPRQRSWIKDVTLIADRILKELKKEVKPPAITKNKSETSYALGYKDGSNAEKVMFITLLHQLHEDLIKDYADFIAED